MIKHCPHCNASIYFRHEIQARKCWKCGKQFIVKQRLSTVTLEAPYIPRNYEAEILEYIKKKGKTCATEIVSGANISKGKVSQVLDVLKENDILSVSVKGRFKWVSLKVEA